MADEAKKEEKIDPAKAAPEEKKSPTLGERAKGYYNAYIYNESSGIKSAGIFAIVAAVGIAFMNGGSWIAKAIAGLVAGIAAIVAAPLISKGWEWASNKLGIANRDRTPSLEKLRAPKGKKPTSYLDAPVHGDEKKHLVQAPILDNLRIPEGKDLQNVMKEYQDTVTRALVISARGAPTAGEQTELNGKFAELKERAGMLSDGFVTWYTYEKRREEYMGKGGEREMLVNSITERTGNDAAARERAEQQVPKLPPIEVPDGAGGKKRLSLKDIVPMNDEESRHYEAAYKASSDKKQYGNKEWADLDPFSRQVFALNQEMVQVRELRGQINTGQMNARDTFIGGHARRAPLAEEDVNFGSYHCWTPRVGTAATTNQDNVSGAIAYYLKQDPFAPSNKECLSGTGNTNLAQLAAYARYQVSCYSDAQKQNDDIPWVGWANDKSSYEAYVKVVQYCEALERLQKRQEQVGQVSGIITQLQTAGKSPELKKAVEDAHHFVDVTLPKEINPAIITRVREEEAKRAEAKKLREEAMKPGPDASPATTGPLKDVRENEAPLATGTRAPTAPQVAPRP